MHPLSRLFPAALALACLPLAGCSIVSPEPIWELTKATGGLASAAISVGPSKASSTVYHLHPPSTDLCIQVNPQTQATDVVYALQAELRSHRIESRVYEGPILPGRCSVWLRYAAQIEWDIPPFDDRYKPYVTNANLSLLTASGRVLATSSYELDSYMQMGKWSSTRDKLAPVVTALVTGFEN